MFKKSILTAAVVFAATTTSSFAASVSPVFIDAGTNTTTAEGTGLFRADVSGLGLTSIAQIVINDSNDGTFGSPGAYSGFDLDAIFLDVDGDASTLGDQIYASSFGYTAGTVRPGGLPSNTAGPLNGSASINAVDEAFATLDAVDAVYFGTGSITLGDGGSLTAFFAPDVVVTPTLYLFVGEVGANGESIDGLIEISDVVPVVPLPASGLLLGGVFAFLGMRRRRKT